MRVRSVLAIGAIAAGSLASVPIHAAMAGGSGCSSRIVSERTESRTVTDGTRWGTQTRTLQHVVTKCSGSPARSHWVAGMWSFAQFSGS